MDSLDKIAKVVKKTKDVFNDCLLPNNCLVAAPGHMPYYPAQAKNYLYCWPGRDLGFCIAAGMLIDTDLYERALAWIWERAEDYQTCLDKWKEGLIFQSYYPNGRKREINFQPDQTGTLLWAISEYGKYHSLSALANKIAKKSAAGIIGAWNGDNFSIVAQDLWEERIVHPRFNNNLAYSLAACASGLEGASKYLRDDKLGRLASEMKSLIANQAYDEPSGFFLRRFGGNVAGDKGIDASMLGLVWPFEIVKPDDPRMVATVQAIENCITDERGVYRYQFDEYEGEIDESDVQYKAGAGAWPLLTFWMSIVQNKMGNREKAEKYFWQVMDQIGDDDLIPEQIFPDGDPRVGVKPLLWSHAMFIHAANELGYLK